MRWSALSAVLVAFPLVQVAMPASAQTPPSSSTAAPSASTVAETPERRRRDFVERTRIQIRSTITANRHEVTEEERGAIRDYWRRSMRLLRIRELAEQAGDQESVARAEKLLERFGKRFYEDLRQLNLRAPTKTARSGELPRPVNTSSGPGAQ